MESIKKVKTTKIDKSVKLPKTGQSPDLSKMYLEMTPVENWSSEEPATTAEMDNLINNLRDNSLSVGGKIATIASIVALPYVNILDGTGTGWAAAGAEHTGPDTAQYNNLHNIAENIRKSMGIQDYEYARGSCAQAVATVLITTYDKNYPIANPTAQEEYLIQNKELYEYVGNVDYNKTWDNVKPGDILMSETIDGHKHTMLCAGIDKQDGSPLIFEAAAVRDEFSMYPIVTKKTINNDAYGRSYNIFRPKE